MSEFDAKKLVIRLLPVEIVLLSYILATGVFQIINYEHLHNIHIHLLMRGFIIACILGVALYASSQNRFSLNGIRVFLPFAALPFLYAETDYMNNIFFTNDLDILVSNLERRIFGFQPSLMFSETFNSDLFAEVMYLGYFSYLVLCIAIPFYVYRNIDKTIGEKFVFIIITSFLAYYVIFIVYPVAGPQYYYSEWPSKVPEGYIFADIMRLLQLFAERSTAAFPSSHVSISILVLIGSYIYSRNLVKFILPVVIILIFSTVYIRAHYVVDAIAGALLSPVLFWAFSSLFETKAIPSLQEISE